MEGITQLLRALDHGDRQAADRLLPLVYEELRKLASLRMSQESPGHTLQPTALVHEAWIRLVPNETPPGFASRAHFFAAAGEAMRRILVDCARQKQALKRGGGRERVELEGLELPCPMPAEELLALDEALTRLAAVDSRASQMVELQFFVGLTQDQCAREMGVSLATAKRIWSFARAWLWRDLQTPHQVTSRPDSRTP